MANLGPLKTHAFRRNWHQPSTIYIGQVPITTVVDLSREIRGTVVELQDDDSEVPIPGAVVKLFYRQSDAVVARTVTEADGSFVFTGLFNAVGAYYAIAFYPGVGGTFPNARIYDRLTAQEP